MSTTLYRVLELAINGDLPGGYNSLLKSKTSSEAQTIRPRMIAGNRFSLRLYFRKPGTSVGGASAVYDLVTPNGMMLVGKKDDPTIEGDSLFSVVDWVKIGADDTTYYQGVLDLTTPAITALFASGPDEVPVTADVDIRDGTDSECLSYRLEMTLCRKVYTGAGILPTTLSASYLQSPDGSTWQCTIDDNGQESWTKIGLEMRDPAFILTQAAVFVTPSGYFYEVTMSDMGQKAIRRIQ